VLVEHIMVCESQPSKTATTTFHAPGRSHMARVHQIWHMTQTPATSHTHNDVASIRKTQVTTTGDYSR